MGTLASGIAHDFNNLLGGALAQAELAMGELAGGSRPEDELKGIRNVALRGSEIVRQLMIYAGKENPAMEPMDFSRIVKETLELLGDSIRLAVAYTQETIADAIDLPQIRSFIHKRFQFAELVQTLRTALSS